MRRACAMAIAAVIALSFSQAGTAQVPGASAPPAASVRTDRTTVITGHVTAADTGKPLKRAQVVLRLAVTIAGGRGPIAITATNTRGEFTFRDIPAGTYNVIASRAGYLELAHGQRVPMEPGQAIEVGSGARLERIDVVLPKTSVLAGRISDERGAAYPGLAVEAYRVQYSLGQRVPMRVASATTDDRGEYRLSDLTPGSYYVAAIANETWIGADRATWGYAQTYFPGVAPPRAGAIALGVAEQRTDVSFSLAAERTARISGQLVGTRGEALAGEPVSLQLRVNTRLTPIATVRTDANGLFEVRDLPPGDYRLASERQPPETPRSRADLDFTVAGASIDGLIVARRPGTELGGVVTSDDGTPLPSAQALGVRMLTPASFTTFRLDADGAFKSVNSMFTPFILRIEGAPAGWILKSIKQGDVELPEGYIVPQAGKPLADLRLVLTSRSAKVEGTVVDAASKPTTSATVVVFPEDESLWVAGSRYLRSIRPGVDGHFAIGDLLAGRYRIVAREFVEDGQGADAEFLKVVRPYSTSFAIEEGESRKLELVVGR